MDVEQIKSEVKIVATTWSPIVKLYELCGGLSEFFALIFATAAIYLAVKGKLDANFSITITSIQGLLCGHDALDDYFRHKREQREADAKRSSDGRA